MVTWLARLSPAPAGKTPGAGLGHQCWYCGKPGSLVVAHGTLWQCLRCEVRWHSIPLACQQRASYMDWLDAQGELVRVPFIDHGAVHVPAP